MKQARIAFSALMLLIIAFSCQKSVETSAIEQKKSNFRISEIANTSWPAGQKICSSPYQISLMVREQLPDGTWLWIWGIKNPNPGDGTNGTVRNLGHWNIQLPDCIKLSNIKAAKMAYLNQLYTYFTPVIEADKSYAACDIDVTNGKKLLKFNLGTNGLVPSYYALILDKEYPIDQNAVAYYFAECREKGTGVTCFPGIGCPEPCVEGCSFSQGYYFAKPNFVWPGNVTIGGHVYTQAEGKAIWKSSNSGGISDAKKAFLQVAAIKLSGSSVGKCATVWNEVNTAENWLKTLPKLTPDNIKNYNNKSVSEAAGRIGRWIDANHCKE